MSEKLPTDTEIRNAVFDAVEIAVFHDICNLEDDGRIVGDINGRRVEIVVTITDD